MLTSNGDHNDDFAVARVERASMIHDRMKQMEADQLGTVTFKTVKFESDTPEGLKRRAEFAHWYLTLIVNHRYFELILAALIAANSITMAFEGQYLGIQLGYELGYHSSPRPVEAAWPNCKITLEIFDWSFGVIFTAECIIKMLCYFHR